MIPKRFGDFLNDFDVTAHGLDNDDDLLFPFSAAGNTLYFVSEYFFKPMKKTPNEGDNVCIHGNFYRLDSLVELTLYDLFRGRMDCYVGHAHSPS